MRCFVINADDLGCCESTNCAIGEAFSRGVLSSASLMPCGAAFDDAVSEVVNRYPGLGIGLHVCLTNGRSQALGGDVGLLVDQGRHFRHGFVSLYRLTLARRRAALEQITREVEGQFERLLDRGVRIDHVDSHRHVHMIPGVFDVVVQLARRYGCPAIRVPHEPFLHPERFMLPSRIRMFLGNLPKKAILSALTVRNGRRTEGLHSAERVFGVLDSGRMDRPALRTLIASAPEGVTEVITHPGLHDVQVDPQASRMERSFLCSPNRYAEFLALVATDVREEFKRQGVRLVRFANAFEP